MAYCSHAFLGLARRSSTPPASTNGFPLPTIRHVLSAEIYFEIKGKFQVELFSESVLKGVHDLTRKKCLCRQGKIFAKFTRKATLNCKKVGKINDP